MVWFEYGDGDLDGDGCVCIYWCVLVGVGRVWRTWMRMYEVIGGGGHMPRYYLVHLSPSQEELAK